MPAYKDKNGTWFAQFNYISYEGEVKQKRKRGFKLRRDALEYENYFLLNKSFQPTMKFKNFLKLYKRDIYPQLREHTIQTKEYRYKRILPHFKNKPMSEVTTRDVRVFLEHLINKDLSAKYINILRAELSAIFNHAVKFYKLAINPVTTIGRVKLPNEKPKTIKFWTFKEFNKVIKHVTDDKQRLALNILYYTGIRKGELYALEYNKIDYKKHTITVDQSLQRLKGRNVITPTKTYEIRVIKVPKFIIDDIIEFREHALLPDDLIFQYEKRFINKAMEQGCKLSGVKKIRIHDIRHSHASYLINRGVNIDLVSKRLGHKNASMTLNTYSHFFPTDEDDLVNLINEDIKNLNE